MAYFAIAFAPENSTSLSATTSSSNTTINKDGDSVRIYNAGPNDVCIRWGIGVAQTALTTDMRIPANAVEVFTKGKADNVAGICATGTATLYITTGTGM